jgi:hypothetical protein
VSALTSTHDAVLAVLDWMPRDIVADVAPVAPLLAIPEEDAARLLDELEEAGWIASVIGLQPVPSSGAAPAGLAQGVLREPEIERHSP